MRSIYWTYMVNDEYRFISEICPPDDAYDEGTLQQLIAHDETCDAPWLAAEPGNAMRGACSCQHAQLATAQAANERLREAVNRFLGKTRTGHITADGVLVHIPMSDLDELRAALAEPPR